jgi:hypothetical protein
MPGSTARTTSRVAYGVQYEGVDIERLSPGTRGIVLLLLYLATDREDDRPLSSISRKKTSIRNRSSTSWSSVFARRGCSGRSSS